MSTNSDVVRLVARKKLYKGCKVRFALSVKMEFKYVLVVSLPKNLKPELDLQLVITFMLFRHCDCVPRLENVPSPCLRSAFFGATCHLLQYRIDGGGALATAGKRENKCPNPLKHKFFVLNDMFCFTEASLSLSICTKVFCRPVYLPGGHKSSSSLGSKWTNHGLQLTT